MQPHHSLEESDPNSYLKNDIILFQYVAFLDVAEREGELFEMELLSNFGALRSKFIKCDISNETQLADAYRQVFEKYRKLDVVINNAAILSADDNHYKSIIDTNFVSIDLLDHFMRAPHYPVDSQPSVHMATPTSAHCTPSRRYFLSVNNTKVTFSYLRFIVDTH